LFYNFLKNTIAFAICIKQTHNVCPCKSWDNFIEHPASSDYCGDAFAFSNAFTNSFALHNVHQIMLLDGLFIYHPMLRMKAAMNACKSSREQTKILK